MADVFISYANGDREMARQLAAALEARGWSVWWDRKIRPGHTFDDAIEREILAAGRVIVLWSTRSTASEWVRSEAGLAMERGVLVPAMIETVKPPLEFRLRQAADLTGWRGEASHPGFLALVDAIGDGAQPNPGEPPIALPRRWSRRWSIAALLVLLVIAASVAVTMRSGNSSSPPAASAPSAPDIVSSAATGEPTRGASARGAGAAPVSVASVAVDVNGIWDLEPSPGRRKVYVELKRAGDTLVGREVIEYSLDALNLRAGIRRQAPILEGKVHGSHVSFITRRTFNRQASDDSTRTTATHRYEGDLAGDTIHFTFSDEQAGEYFEWKAVKRPSFPGAELVATLRQHAGAVEQLVVLPRGRLVSASRDRRLVVWNIETGAVQTSLRLESPVVGAVAVGDGRIGGYDDEGRVLLWDGQSQAVSTRLAEGPAKIDGLAALADGRLASSYDDGSVTLRAAATGVVEKTLRAAGRAPLRLAALPGGRLAVGDDEGRIRLWDLTTGQVEQTMQAGEGADHDVTALLSLPDGRLASAARGAGIAVWDTSTGRRLLTLPPVPGEEVKRLVLLRDGRLAALEPDTAVVIWNLTTRRKDNMFEVGEEPFAASSIVELPDGRLAIGQGGGAIEIWTLR